MKKRTYIKIISFLTALTVVLAITSIVYSVKSSRLTYYINMDRERSLASLSEALGEIETELFKSLYTADLNSLSEYGEELQKLSATAKLSFSELTEENMESDGVFKFLSQVGDYTCALSQKEKLSKEDMKNLSALYEYAKKLNLSFGELTDNYYFGEINFMKALGNLQKSSENLSFLSSYENISQNLSDYPTLIYDGPFSDSMLNKKSVLLEKEKEITKAEGKKIAGEILNVSPNTLKEEEDQNSNLPLYVFTKGEKAIGLTKKGGYLAYITNPNFSGKESTISEKEAVARGKEYLKKLGFPDMKESYYSLFDGVCTINFAYRKAGITYYADLIKVGISLDSGKLLSLDSRSYLMNHKERSIPEKTFSVRECEKTLSKNLSVIKRDYAVIPLENGTEKYCVEFHCKTKTEEEVLVYINAETKRQEQLLILLYTDGGVLSK